MTEVERIKSCMFVGLDVVAALMMERGKKGGMSYRKQ